MRWSATAKSSYTRGVDPRLASIARNEALLRAVNQQIERLSADLGDRSWTTDGRIEFYCECERTCDGRVPLTLAEYDAAHEQNDRFVALAEHVTPEIEVVVERHDRYVVVDKLPAAERLVGADGIAGSDPAT